MNGSKAFEQMLRLMDEFDSLDKGHRALFMTFVLHRMKAKAVSESEEQAAYENNLIPSEHRKLIDRRFREDIEQYGRIMEQTMRELELETKRSKGTISARATRFRQAGNGRGKAWLKWVNG